MARLAASGEIVEADETYFGKMEKPRVSPTRKGRPYTKCGKSGPRDQASNRCACRARRQRPHVPCSGCRSRRPSSKIVAENIARELRLHTDESRLYPDIGTLSPRTRPSNTPSGEYVRYEMACIHTNSAEGYFSIFKRGMRGVYQHCKEKHLHRYLAEFDHRYNHRVALGYSDIDRTLAAIRGIEGKRLMYRQPD